MRPTRSTGSTRSRTSIRAPLPSRLWARALDGRVPLIQPFARDGRYRIHPLLRQMGNERLAANASEHAGVADGVEAGWGHAGGQPGEQRQRVHVDCDRPVGVRLLQRDAHQAVGAMLQALLRDGRTQHVAQQSLPPRPVPRPHAGGRVQREPVEQRRTAACRRRGSAAAAAPNRSPTGDPREAPGPRRRRQRGCSRGRQGCPDRRRRRRSGAGRAGEGVARCG